MEPGAAPVLVGAADADLRRAGIAEQEVGEGVARPLAVEREVAARVVRVDRVELQVEEIAAELQVVIAAIDHHVVVQLEAPVVARDERRRVADAR